jgi:Mg-chelatase subunit ChlI
VFITGSAGTGKSHLLRVLVDALPADATLVTAPTGIAATNLPVSCAPRNPPPPPCLLSLNLHAQRGTTIHEAIGIPPLSPQTPLSALVSAARVRRGRAARCG